jgi:hypothetical protein
LIATLGIVFERGVMGTDPNADDRMLLQPTPLGGSQGQLGCGRGWLGGEKGREKEEGQDDQIND